MIDYVNNAFDKVLKPCDAQQFNTLVSSEGTEKLILGHRGGDPRAKSKLPALTYMGVLDTEKYKQYYQQTTEQGLKPLGSRRIEFMVPTGLFMLDFDHIDKQATASPCPSQGGVTRTSQMDGASPQPSPKEREPQASRTTIDSPVKLWEYIESFLTSHPSLTSAPSGVDLRLGGAGGGLGSVALAHVTPSGDGLRVVVKREKGKTIEQCQQSWCEAVLADAIGIKPDPACKDISRLSFAPMQSEILYFNPSLLFAPLPDAADYPDGTLFETHPNPPCEGGNSVLASAPAMSAPPPSQGGMGWVSEYNGVPYSEIVKRLEEQLGGRPEHGARNSFIFSMACNLRYICNDDAQWVASILPTYGEDAQKHRATVQSAINRPMSREMPETMKRALRISGAAMGENSEFRIHHSELAPEMPEDLPQPLALLTSRTPEKMRPAVAMAVFPPLGAHVKGTRFAYWDGRDYEPTFMNVLVAELSTGKSAVNTPIQYIIADIKDRDVLHRSKMQSWRDACMGIASTKDKPERPKGLYVQCLSPDMTNAAFVQRLSDAEGHFLYTVMDEIELLNALKTNTQGGNSVSAVLRLAFDCGEYGQERVAANAIDAQVQVRWNWNASSTVQRVRKFFARNIADGTLSRVSFATIVKEKGTYGRNRPTFGRYGEDFARELRPYIDALTTCSDDIHCPEASAWALALCDELADFAEEMEDEVYAQISHRAVLMGFFRASLLYVMNGMQWSQQIADFAAWTVKYDLWCKMRFFSDMLHADLEGEEKALQRGPRGLLEMLPKEFTKQQVVELRKSLGMSANANDVVKKWKKRGLIVLSSTPDTYEKCRGRGTVTGDN